MYTNLTGNKEANKGDAFLYLINKSWRLVSANFLPGIAPGSYRWLPNIVIKCYQRGDCASGLVPG